VEGANEALGLALGALVVAAVGDGPGEAFPAAVALGLAIAGGEGEGAGSVPTGLDPPPLQPASRPTRKSDATKNLIPS
jgi:hypothetical protein